MQQKIIQLNNTHIFKFFKCECKYKFNKESHVVKHITNKYTICIIFVINKKQKSQTSDA